MNNLLYTYHCNPHFKQSITYTARDRSLISNRDKNLHELTIK